MPSHTIATTHGLPERHPFLAHSQRGARAAAICPKSRAASRLAHYRVEETIVFIFGAAALTEKAEQALKRAEGHGGETNARG